MIQSKPSELSKARLAIMKPEEILYAEISEIGAMGNTGGIILYVIEDDALICFDTSVFTHQELYIQARDLIYSAHQLHLGHSLFREYYGGMGNVVFVNKAIQLEIQDAYFTFLLGDNLYRIDPSVEGVFVSVVHGINNPEPPWN
jgi:hypothetical protein